MRECVECFETATKTHMGEPLCDLHWRVRLNLEKKFRAADDDETMKRAGRALGVFPFAEDAA